jgi:hypothetical protein
MGPILRLKQQLGLFRTHTVNMRVTYKIDEGICFDTKGDVVESGEMKQS